MKKTNPELKGEKDKLEPIDEEEAKEIMTKLKLTQDTVIEIIEVYERQIGEEGSGTKYEQEDIRTSDVP